MARYIQSYRKLNIQYYCSLLVVACSLLLIFSADATATNSTANNGKIWIVSIGVSRYSKPGYIPLKGAQDGAEQIAKLLSDAQPGITENPRILTPDCPDDYNRPTRGFVLATFAQLAKLIKPADRVIVYFAGHGIEVGGKSYLLLMDITDYRNPDLLKEGSISVEELRNRLNALNCKESILLLDACRVEALEVAGDADINNTSKPFTKVTANALNTQGQKNVTLFGCQPGERACYNANGLSLFTEALIEGLHGEKTSVDAKGQITMSSLGAYVKDRVPALAKEQNRSQKPAMYPAVLPSNAWVLRPGPPVIACPLFTTGKKHNEIETRYNDAFTQLFTTELAASNEVTLVERTHLENLMKELKLQDSGLTDPSTAKKLGQISNAGFIVIGTVREAPGNHLLINVRLVETASGIVVEGCASACEFDPNDGMQWKQQLLSTANQLLDAMREKGLTNQCAGDPGTLRIETNPPGARVSINGAPQDAVTPLSIKKLQAGSTVTVSAALDGYEEYRQEVAVGTRKPLLIDLLQMRGTITVKSTPAGAKISINGTERGVTGIGGLMLSNLPVGNYTVAANLYDYRGATQQVQVTNRYNSPVDLTLQALPKPTITVDLRCKTPLLSSGYQVYGSPGFADGTHWTACTTVKNTGVITLSDVQVSYKFGEYCAWTSPKRYAKLLPGDEIIDKAYPILPSTIASLSSRNDISVTATVSFNAPDKPGLSKAAVGQLTLLGNAEFSFCDDAAKQSPDWKDQFSNAYFLAAFACATDTPVVELADLTVKSLSRPSGDTLPAGIEPRLYCKALYDLLAANEIVCKDPRGFLRSPDASGGVQYPRQTLETRKGTSLDLSLLFASACLARDIPAGVLIKPGKALVLVSLPGKTTFPIDLTGLRDAKRARRDGIDSAITRGQDELARMADNGVISSYTIDIDQLWAAGLSSSPLAPIKGGMLAEWGYQLPQETVLPIKPAFKPDKIPPSKPAPTPSTSNKPDFY